MGDQREDNEGSVAGAFLAWCQLRAQASEGLSESSKRVYRAMWFKFTRYLAIQGIALDQCGTEAIGAFLESLSNQTGSRGTTLTAPNAAHDRASRDHRRRYVWLIAQIASANPTLKRLENNATAILATPHASDLLAGGLPAARPQPLHNDAREALIARVSQLVDHDHWKTARIAALAAFMLGTGAKPAEAFACRLGDLGFDPQRLPYKVAIAGTRSRRPHETPIAEWASPVLNRWIARLRREMASDPFCNPGCLVFPGDTPGKTLVPSTVFRQLRQLFDEVSWHGERGGGHQLRDTFALQQFKGHAQSMETIANWLGYARAESANRYRSLVTTNKGVG